MTEQIMDFTLTDNIWPFLILIRNAVLGTVSVGLAIGACLLVHFLFKLSRM